MKKIIRYLISATVVTLILYVLASYRFITVHHEDKDRIHGKWESVLLDQASSVDQLTIRRTKDEAVAYTTSDKKEILVFLELIEVDEINSESHCFCTGSLHFSFDQGVRNLVALSFHHDQSLRWADGYWPCDAELTTDSRKNNPEMVARKKC